MMEPKLTRIVERTVGRFVAEFDDGTFMDMVGMVRLNDIDKANGKHRFFCVFQSSFDSSIVRGAVLTEGIDRGEVVTLLRKVTDHLGLWNPAFAAAVI